MSHPHKPDPEEKLEFIRVGLEAVLILLDKMPEAPAPAKSLVETMLKIVVDEEQH